MAKKITQSAAEKEMAKFFGEDLYLTGEDIFTKVPVIRTGSPSLDLALGVGGIPRGRIIQLAGREGGGKTMLSLLMIAEYQKENPKNNAIFIDAEYTYDPVWARSLGVDTKRVILIRQNEGNKIFDGIIGIPPNPKSKAKVPKKRMKGFLDHIAEGTDDKFKNVGIIVLDSVAQLMSKIEASSEAGKLNVSPLARLMTSELKKLTPAVAAANVCFVFINQLRDNVGDMWGPATKSPGGRALKHACSVMIEVVPVGGSLVKDEFDDPIGHTVKATVKKNKVSRSFLKGEYQIFYTEGIKSKSAEIALVAHKVGALKKASAQVFLLNGQRLNGMANVVDYLEKNPKFALELEEECRDIYLRKWEDDDYADEEEESEEMVNPLMPTDGDE